MKIQLKRSSILENGVAKEPTAGQMEYGELAVNYNENDISIFTKDSDNNIRRVGGSINKGSGEPGDPGTTPGDWYFDITNGILFYWNGTEWEEVQSVNKLIAGNGIEITTATTGSTFTVDLAGGDDGLEFDGGKLKATLASESDYGVVKIGDGVVADNGVIKAKNTITVGENPPAINLKQGDLWWNSNEDNGRLYVYYEDENTQQWIDASPQGGNLEQDQADTLYLSKKNDDTAAGNITFDKNIYVKQTASIGGTTADPNIKLNADGSGEFGSGSTRIKPAYIEHASSVNSKSDLNALIGGSISGVNRFGIAFSDKLSPATLADYNFYYDIGTKELVSDGSATFAGDVIAGDYDNSEGVKVFASGWVNLKQPDGTSNSSVNLRTNIGSTRTSEITADGSRYIGGTGTTAKIKLKSDGSASFAGIVTSDRPVSGTPANTWACFNGGNNGTITSSIRADGSANFAGAVSGGNWDVTTAQENWYIADGLLAIAKSGTQPDSGTITVYSGAGINNTFRVRADGGVEVGGTIPSAPNISLNANGNVSTNGYVFSNRTSPGNTCFRGTLNGATTFEVDARGQATFGSDSNNQVFISSTGDLTSTRTSGSSNVLVAQTGGVTQGKILADGSIQCGGTLPSAPNISLNASDGSAEFAGFVYCGNIDKSSTTTSGVTLSYGGNINVQREQNVVGAVFEGLQGTTQTSVINSDGSASFATASASPSTAHTVTAFNTSLDTETTSTYFAQNTAGGRLWKGSDGTETSTIWADGSATFAGRINSTKAGANVGFIGVSSDIILAGTDDDYCVRAGTGSLQLVTGTGAGVVALEIDDLQNSYFAGTISNPTFNGASDAGTGCSIGSSGTIQAQRNTGYVDTTNVYVGLYGKTVTYSVSAAGNINAANVTFNLEPDNPANYTTTEDVETYTGPTMDVKDTLLKVTAALALLKSSAAAATTYQELQTAIDTALADV